MDDPRIDPCEHGGLALWEQYFLENIFNDAGEIVGGPWEGDDCGNAWCHFCVKEWPDHERKCVYRLAWGLIELFVGKPLQEHNKEIRAYLEWREAQGLRTYVVGEGWSERNPR